MILECLPDAHCLLNASLTCKSFHQIIQTNKQRLTLRIRTSCFGLELTSEALWVLQCEPLYQARDAVADLDENIERSHLCGKFATDFLQKGPPDIHGVKLTLGQIIELCQFHTAVVEPLAQDFVKYCTETSLVGIDDSLQTRPPTHTEYQRTIRSLYRFELFRKLYACFAVENGDLYVAFAQYFGAFFYRFAPWETIQISCIHDYLGRKIARQFNRVAETDSKWSHHFARDTYGPLDGAIQHFLSLGLRWIHHMLSLDSYDDLHNATRKGLLPPTENYLFWYEYLSDELYQAPESLVSRISNAAPFYDDGDSGAEKLWRRAFEENPMALYEEQDWQYRRWGYALWDTRRLNELGILDGPWQPAPHPSWPDDYVG